MSGTRPLRVLVVNPSAVLGGAESWLLSMLDATTRLAPEVLLLADGPLRAEVERRGIPVTVLPVGPGGLDVARAGARLVPRLRRGAYDVLLTNGVKAQAVLGPAAAAVGLPCVWVKHDHSFDGPITRALAAVATAVVATVEDVGVPTGRSDVVVVEPPRPPEPLARERARPALRAHGLPETERLRLVMPGRLIPYKGVDTAIRALGLTGAEDWELVAIGGDEPSRPKERARLRSLADASGVADRVHLLGHVPDVSRLLAAADAVAVLTRPDGHRGPGREGFGMVALEASLAGRPVLAVDDGGPVARRVGSGAGLLVPVDAPAAVAAALGALTDPGLREALGQEGRERAARQPDAAQAADALARTLAVAASRPGAGLVAKPPVSVVSPVLDERAVIERLVTAVVEQLGPDEEYVLVDGSSTDGTTQWLQDRARHDPRVRVRVVPAGTSIGAARNAGVEAARHDRLAFTDAGCLPEPGWLAGCRAALAERGVEVALGTYDVAVSPGRPFEAAMAAAAWPDPEELRRSTPWRRAYGRAFGRRFDPRRLDGRSLAVTRAAWARAEGFPEHLRTAEDEAFGRALQRVGARAVLTLDARVVWFQRGSVGATFRQFRGYGEGGGRSRSPRLLAKDAVRAGAYLVAPVLAVRGGPLVRSAVVTAGAAYLSVPAARVLRRREPIVTVALLPATLLLKDVAKLVGTARTLLLDEAGVSGRRT